MRQIVFVIVELYCDERDVQVNVINCIWRKKNAQNKTAYDDDDDDRDDDNEQM